MHLEDGDRKCVMYWSYKEWISICYKIYLGSSCEAWDSLPELITALVPFISTQSIYYYSRPINVQKCIWNQDRRLLPLRHIFEPMLITMVTGFLACADWLELPLPCELSLAVCLRTVLSSRSALVEVALRRAPLGNDGESRTGWKLEELKAASTVSVLGSTGLRCATRKPYGSHRPVTVALSSEMWIVNWNNASHNQWKPCLDSEKARQLWKNYGPPLGDRNVPRWDAQARMTEWATGGSHYYKLVEQTTTVTKWP